VASQISLQGATSLATRTRLPTACVAVEVWRENHRGRVHRLSRRPVRVLASITISVNRSESLSSPRFGRDPLHDGSSARIHRQSTPRCHREFSAIPRDVAFYNSSHQLLCCELLEILFAIFREMQ